MTEKTSTPKYMNKITKYFLILSLAFCLQSLIATPTSSLEEKAMSGDANAMYALSKNYLNLTLDNNTQKSGDNSENAKQAFYWAKKAYENGNIDATERLGVFYEKAIATPKDLDKAFELYTKASERNNPYALLRLALLCYPIENDNAREKYASIDKSKALFAKFLEVLESQDNLDKELYLLAINNYMEGSFVEKDSLKAVSLIKKLFEKSKKDDGKFAMSESEIINAMIFCYIRGIGVEKDLDKALSIWQEKQLSYFTYMPNFNEYELGLLKLDTTENYNSIARSYYYSESGKLKALYAGNRQKAKALYEKSIELGSHLAYYYLGNFFYFKKGTYEKALELYHKCYEHIGENPNLEEAQVILALANAYNNNKATPRDIKKAKAFYEKIPHNSIAIQKLGYIYYEQEDFEKALEYFLKASRKEASSNLYSQIAKCYKEGLGTPQDLKKALDYYRKALKYTNYKEEIYAKIKEVYEVLGIAFVENEASLEERAKAGDADAMYELAEENLIFTGITSSSSRSAEARKTGFYWYKKAYENGNIKAIEKLGRCYESASGTEMNKGRALKLYKEGWQKGSPTALLLLCKIKVPIHYHSTKTTLEESKTPEYQALLKLARQRDDLEPCIYEYLAKHCIIRENKEAIYFLEKAIENQCEFDNFHSETTRAFCTITLAQYYLSGTLVEKDEQRAKELIKTIPLQNTYTDASIFLAYKLGIYKLELGTDFLSVARMYDPNHYTMPLEKCIFEPNLEKAFEYYQKSADLNNISAKLQLINLYKRKDPKKAFEESIKLLNTSPVNTVVLYQYADAALYIANCYKAGNITQKDLEKAVQYYKKSAEFRNKEAMYELAKLYFNGDIVELNYDKALKYLLEIGDKHREPIFYEMLAQIYEYGLGKTTKDLEKAIDYYKKQEKNTAIIHLIKKLKIYINIKKLEHALEKTK